jgi:hypothetical protein
MENVVEAIVICGKMIVGEAVSKQNAAGFLEDKLLA